MLRHCPEIVSGFLLSPANVRAARISEKSATIVADFSEVSGYTTDPSFLIRDREFNSGRSLARTTKPVGVLIHPTH